MTIASETASHLTINALTGETTTIQLRPRAGLTVAGAEAELAARRAEALTINPESCATIKYYVEAVDIYGLFDVPEEWSCRGKELFVRNLPDGCWVWDGDLPEDTRKKLWERFERAKKETIR
jgi:hypothetical protein